MIHFKMIKLLLVFIFIQGFLPVYSLCPLRCKCRPSNKPQAEWLRVICKDDIEDIMEIDFNPISIEMIHLDLSKNDISLISVNTFKNLSNLKHLNLSANKITVLDEETFDGLINLERLDLSKNSISSIDSHVFKRLPNLKKLDLSKNKISLLGRTIFHGLLALDRLKLNGNKLETLKEGTFHGLPLLRQLDVSANPWKCDCNLFWFSYWIQNNSIKINPAPECDSPSNFKGKLVKKLKIIKEFECNWSTPSIEIVPDQNQVVFAGDTVTFKCRAPSITNDRYARLYWLWYSNITSDIVDLELYNDPRVKFNDIKIENRYLDDSGIVSSVLNIDPVKESHIGQWNCFLISTYGNISRAINVIVISNSTQYCPLSVTRSNKGIYAWPRTVLGWKVELDCEGNGVSIGLQPAPKATYECNDKGQWINLNTEQCPYVSATTKILEQFSTVNVSLTTLSLPKGSLLETIKKLKNITGEGVSLTDPVEIHFVTQILENYASYLVEEKELGTMLIDVVNVLLNLPKPMLKAAEIQYKACTRLIKTIEMIVEVTPANQLIQLHKTNMALEEYRVKPETFAGLMCTWYNNIDSIYPKSLHCSMNNKSSILNPHPGETSIEASIQLPRSLFNRVKSSNTNTYQLMVSMFTDNKLFPKIKNFDNMDITSSIAGSKLIGVNVQNLTEPVFIMLKAPLIHYSNSKPIPVVWDSSLNNKTGGWTSDGCHLSNFINNLIIFHCDRLSYYGLLQDKSFLDENGKTRTGAVFKYSHPAIYVGSFILLFCLICSTVTYVCCYASIAMPKRAKHGIVNTWIAMALLCFLYTSGIQQTENLEICQGVGIGLHYLTLCCLLWMTVSASNMYKRLTKSSDPITDDDELQEPPIRKPVLGLYLVGWGIALIICGISGAINMREYASYSHCFLNSMNSLVALIAPSTILLVYLIILYMLIRCTIRSVDLNGQLSESTQATENVDLELLEPNPHPVTDGGSLDSTPTVSSEVVDQEHSLMKQLKALFLVLLLYVATWMCGAMTTTDFLTSYNPYKEMIFAILYAVFSSFLGGFILFFYGIARSDVRGQWLRMRCWLKQKKNRCCRTRNVSDSNPTIPTQPLVPIISALPPIAAPISNSQATTQATQITQITSDTNSLGSSRHTHKSLSSCNTAKIALANERVATQCHVKPNIIMLHRQQYRSNNSVTTYNTESIPATVEMFYNPHQSGVARKFFKKQRRNMNKNSKNSNLGPRKQGDGGANSDNGACVGMHHRRVPVKLDNDIERNILGSSSKVNNTNIHVEMNQTNDAKNVNILSDSGGSISEDRNLALRYVIGQESISKNPRKINNELSPLPSNGSSRRKYHHMTNIASCNSSYESDTPESTKIQEEAKQMRNVSQQCSLECSSEVESTTREAASEHSERNISEVSEVPESRSSGARSDRRSSIDETLSTERDRRIAKHRSLDICKHHSGSLSSLPTADRSLSSRTKGSYRSSLNDTSFDSSRALDDYDDVRRGSNSATVIDTERQQLDKFLPFPSTAITSTAFETKVTTGDESENNDDDTSNSERVVDAVIPLVEENVDTANGESLPLYDFTERDTHVIQYKQHHQTNNDYEGNREVRDDAMNGIEAQLGKEELLEAKIETSV